MDIGLDLGKHAVFIWASYGAVGFVLGALILWLILDGGRLSRQIEELEADGVRRRSDDDAKEGGS